MNKMIKRQDLVPPWIEKQQELVKAAHTFRMRLRTDWRRHAARTIASRGGSLQQQMHAAEEYARAEEAKNPRRRDSEQISVPTNLTSDVVMANSRQQQQSEIQQQRQQQQKEEEKQTQATAVDNEAAAPARLIAKEGPAGIMSKARANDAEVRPESVQISITRPFRDAAWEAREQAYLELSVANLNTLTRSYNLMAPELARKPYFSLERELAGCFADVAPQVAGAIKERAARPGHRWSSSSSEVIWDRFGAGGGSGAGTRPANIYESKSPNYGLKEMWRDLWKSPP
jgi:hypothetical protein